MEEQQQAPLDPREQELLKYLEDLQANNPAEYDLLVQELQEKKIRVSVKQTKHRLFLGNIDRHKTKKEVIAALLLVAPGLVRSQRGD